jgi:hypothetical protein
MGNKPTEKITIEGIGQYGPKANGRYYYISKMSALTNASFIPGATYNVEVYTSDKGAKYINKIVSGNDTATQESAPEVKQTAPAQVPYDAEKKQRQIQAQGCIQAAMQCPVLPMLASTKEDVVNVASWIAAEMLTYIKDNS